MKLFKFLTIASLLCFKLAIAQSSEQSDPFGLSKIKTGSTFIALKDMQLLGKTENYIQNGNIYVGYDKVDVRKPFCKFIVNVDIQIYKDEILKVEGSTDYGYSLILLNQNDSYMIDLSCAGNMRRSAPFYISDLKKTINGLMQINEII